MEPAVSHRAFLPIPGVPAQGSETVTLTTAPTDQPAGGRGCGRERLWAPFSWFRYLEIQKREARNAGPGQLVVRLENLWGTESFWMFGGTGRQPELQG